MALEGQGLPQHRVKRRSCGVKCHPVVSADLAQLLEELTGLRKASQNPSGLTSASSFTAKAFKPAVCHVQDLSRFFLGSQCAEVDLDPIHMAP